MGPSGMQVPAAVFHQPRSGSVPGVEIGQYPGDFLGGGGARQILRDGHGFKQALQLCAVRQQAHEPNDHWRPVLDRAILQDKLQSRPVCAIFAVVTERQVEFNVFSAPLLVANSRPCVRAVGGELALEFLYGQTPGCRVVGSVDVDSRLLLLTGLSKAHRQN